MCTVGGALSTKNRAFSFDYSGRLGSSNSNKQGVLNQKGRGYYTEKVPVVPHCPFHAMQRHLCYFWTHIVKSSSLHLTLSPTPNSRGRFIREIKSESIIFT